jgi:hypothetical protein
MFYPYTRDTGALQPWEEMPAKAGTYQAGQVLAVSGNVLAVCGAPMTTRPAYISMFSGTAIDNQVIPVIRVTERIVFKTELTADVENLSIGSKLQVSAGGEGVDGTAEGAFEVTAFDGKTAGSVVYGRFV